MANTPYIATPTMITILRTIPHFRATTHLGESSGPRKSSSTCTPSVMPCTCSPVSVIPRSLFSVPLSSRHWLIVSPASYLSSKRLLEVVEAPIALSRHLALPSCETWVHHSYTIALLGDSAHPNLVSCAFQRGSASDSFSPVTFSSAVLLLINAHHLTFLNNPIHVENWDAIISWQTPTGRTALC